MKKALALLAAAVVLLTAVFFVRSLRERAERGPRPAFGERGLTADSVTRLRVDYRGEQVTLTRARGGHWLTRGDGFPADTLRMHRVLGYLLGLQTRETVARGETVRHLEPALAEFGLDSAEARHVEWELFDGRVFRVRLGKVSGLDFGSSYWKPADAAVAYRTPGTFVFEVSSRPRDWKDTALFAPFASADIQGVEVTWRDEVDSTHAWALERAEGDSAFMLRAAGTSVPAAQVDRVAAARIFMHAAQFKVDEFVPDVRGADPAATPQRRAMLDTNPVMVIRIRLKSGRMNTVIAGPALEGLYRYVKHPWHPDPVRVFGWRFEYFRKTAEDFRGKIASDKSMQQENHATARQ